MGDSDELCSYEAEDEGEWVEALLELWDPVDLAVEGESVVDFLSSVDLSSLTVTLNVDGDSVVDFFLSSVVDFLSSVVDFLSSVVEGAAVEALVLAVEALVLAVEALVLACRSRWGS